MFIIGRSELMYKILEDFLNQFNLNKNLNAKYFPIELTENGTLIE